MTATEAQSTGVRRIRPDAYLPAELVNLLGSIMRNESSMYIAQRAEDIARAYELRSSPSDPWDDDRREIVRLMNETADLFRRKAMANIRTAADGGDSSLRRIS